MSIEKRAHEKVIREVLTVDAKGKERPAIPGLGEFDSGHTDTSQKAEEILRRATERGKWSRPGL